MKNKFLLIALAGVLVIFIGLIVYLAKTGKIKPSAEVAGPSLTLSPGSQTVAVDQTFNVNIIVDTAGLEADGVDVFHLHYDPAVLEVQDADTTSVGVQIQKGSIFPMWPANSVNTSSGEISISGIVNVGQDLPGYVSSPGNDVFATITFKALAPATTTTLHFDATPGYTTDSNISEHGGTGVDLLVSAPDGNYTVTGAETPRHKECNTIRIVSPNSLIVYVILQIKPAKPLQAQALINARLMQIVRLLQSTTIFVNRRRKYVYKSAGLDQTSVFLAPIVILHQHLLQPLYQPLNQQLSQRRQSTVLLPHQSQLLL
ncbi:MAG: hypothetical protein HW405_271 [Candidatus Berkelbacteria bacterium]|nr:hypothetical protein [Candidatus Berkelbacteria bacterium]